MADAPLTARLEEASTTSITPQNAIDYFRHYLYRVDVDDIIFALYNI